MSTQVSRKITSLARRAVLASLLCGASTAFGEVIDIPTSPIGSGVSYPRGVVAQAQAQAPAVTNQQPSAPIGNQQFQPPIREFPSQDILGESVPAPPGVTAGEPPQDVPPTLNADPNADISDLVPPPPVPPPAPPRPTANRRRAGLGATAAGFSSAPTMIGDLFGGGLSTISGGQTIPFSGYSSGTILSGGPGQANSQLVFEFGSDIVPDDVFTTGLGLDLAGNDGFADTFQIAEPLPPSDAPTSPGPGFTFDGGTAVFTADNGSVTTPQPGQYIDGSTWYLSYSYSQSILGVDQGGRPVPAPGVSVRRVKLSENFSPEVRNRCFASYNFFNDAYGGLGDVSRYTLGLERILVDELVSVEARLLMAGTYGSTQVLEDAESRSFELGNAVFLSKGVLLRNDHFIWSAGVGFTIPSADDTRIQRGGQDILVIKNKTYHILPFTALLLRASEDTFLQAYMQLDVAANGDPLYGNLAGGPLPQLGVFTDSTLMTLDFAVNHVLHRSRSRSLVSQVIANGEIHYTGTLQESDFVTSNGLTYTNLQRYFNVVNATAGLHLVLGSHVVVTPAMSIPLRDGLNEQFDYEAICQINYLH